MLLLIFSLTFILTKEKTGMTSAATYSVTVAAVLSNL